MAAAPISTRRWWMLSCTSRTSSTRSQSSSKIRRMQSRRKPGRPDRSMSRTDAIADIERYFDGGKFVDDLARRVAIPTESQNAERSLSLTYYLKDELQPALERQGFKCTI